MQQLRFGIIGFGKMGQTRARSLEHDKRAIITKVFDVESLDGHTSYPQAKSIEEIVQDPNIDGVYICLPNHLNYPTTLAALRAGKHVFCEKPPAFNAEEMREVIRAEKASGKVLMYGFNHRHHEAVAKMKSFVDEGTYGRILWMRGRYGKSVDHDYLQTWRADRAKAGGGILIDQGIHMLDLFNYISGARFEEVAAFVSSRYWKIPGIEDNVFAIMRNAATGIEVSFHSTMTQWRHLFSLEVFMERGYLVLNGLKTSSGTYGEEVLTIAKNRTVAPAATWQDEERFVFDADTSWDHEAEHFLNAVIHGTPVRQGSSAHALEVMELVDRIYLNKHSVAAELHETLRTVQTAS